MLRKFVFVFLFVVCVILCTCLLWKSKRFQSMAGIQSSKCNAIKYVVVFIQLVIAYCNDGQQVTKSTTLFWKVQYSEARRKRTIYFLTNHKKLPKFSCNHSFPLLLGIQSSKFISDEEKQQQQNTNQGIPTDKMHISLLGEAG